MRMFVLSLLFFAMLGVPAHAQTIDVCDMKEVLEVCVETCRGLPAPPVGAACLADCLLSEDCESIFADEEMSEIYATLNAEVVAPNILGMWEGDAFVSSNTSQTFAVELEVVSQVDKSITGNFTIEFPVTEVFQFSPGGKLLSAPAFGNHENPAAQGG